MPIFKDESDLLSWWEGRYQDCLKKFGPDSAATKAYKHAIEKRESGLHKKSLAEVMSHRPLTT